MKSLYQIFTWFISMNAFRRSGLSLLTRSFGAISTSKVEGSQPSFSDLYNLPPLVLENLAKQNFIYPTEIQKKSLTSLLDESCSDRYSVINAETGSGKTLCFLLPILKMFGEEWGENGSIPTACATILVPSPHLAQQIANVFQSLAHPEWNIAVAAFNHSTFSFTKQTHLLVGVPGKLKHYSMGALFSNNRILCLDEADMLLKGEVHATKSILKYVQTVHERQSEEKKQNSLSPDINLSTVKSQIILTAATLPMNGPQTVGMQLSRLLPDVTFIKTENTHKVLENTELRFVRFPGESKDAFDNKLACLEKDLGALGQNGTNDGKETTLMPKVLIFTNTLENASKVASFLIQHHNEAEKSSESEDISKWWSGRVGAFFKQPGKDNDAVRELVISDFRRGVLRVLVSNDMASRGLDFPDCSCVIQFDFPLNCEFFLHRAGRTSRAGRSGTVISYVGDSDVDISNEIQKNIESRESLDAVFSRNKMFRRRMKRKMKPEG